jgi:hypothetical protein
MVGLTNDLDKELDSSSTGKITGNDENLVVDVVREDNVNKLYVKSTTVPSTTKRLIFEQFLDGASTDMNVNGTLGSPVIFKIVADPTDNKIIRELKFTSFASGIKIDKFLSQNQPLTNGILVRVTTDNGATVQEFFPIKTTQDFDGHFAYGDGARFELIFASGSDSMIAQFSPREPFVLTANTADQIEIQIRDNLNSIAELHAVAFGLFSEVT